MLKCKQSTHDKGTLDSADKSYGVSSQVLGLISSFLNNRQVRVNLDGKLSQGSILGPALFLLYINDLLDDIICNTVIYADVTTLYSKCDQACDLWQQLELASEFEFDLRDTGLGQEVVC